MSESSALGWSMSALLQNIPSKKYFIKMAWLLKPQIFSDQKNTQKKIDKKHNFMIIEYCEV